MVVRLRSALRPHNALSTERYTGIANGDVVDTTQTPQKVAAAANRPKGIVVDAIPTDNPPQMVRLAVSGDIIEDTGLTSQTEGALIWSDGDGTYSVTQPAAAGSNKNWSLGYVKHSDATSTIIYLDFQLVQEDTA